MTGTRMTEGRPRTTQERPSARLCLYFLAIPRRLRGLQRIEQLAGHAAISN
jgi:hypothetical protein